MSGSKKARSSTYTSSGDRIVIKGPEELEIDLLRIELDNLEERLSAAKRKADEDERTIARLESGRIRAEAQNRLMQVVINQKEEEIRSLSKLDAELRELLYDYIIRVITPKKAD